MEPATKPKMLKARWRRVDAAFECIMVNPVGVIQWSQKAKPNRADKGRRVCSTLVGPSGLAFLPVHWTRFGLRVRQESRLLP